MDDNVACIIIFLTIFGWIPILALGSAIRSIVLARTCNRCTCHNCKKEKESVSND